MIKNKILDKRELFIFDLDGTILDSLGLWSEIDRAFFTKRNLQVPVDYDKAISHMNFTQMAVYTKNRFSLLDEVDDIVKEWLDMSYDAYAHKLKLKEGVKEFLKLLKGEGKKIALATSTKRELFKPCLINNGVWDYFDLTVSGEELETTKKEPKIYLYLASECSISIEDAVVFEDLLQAIITAKKAGFCLFAVYDAHNKKDIEKIKENSDELIYSYLDLL